jgi:hypothetical protein
MLLWWKLDDAGGLTAIDSSGNGHSGALSAGLNWFSPGKIGASSVNWPGDNVERNIQTANDIIDGLSAFTVSFWMICTSAVPNTAALCANGGSGKGFTFFYVPTSLLNFTVVANSTVTDVYNLPGGVDLTSWTYVVGTYDGVRLKLYINGALADDQALTGTIVSGWGTFFVGDYVLGTKLQNVTIDEVRVQSRALNSTEILTIWNLYH